MPWWSTLRCASAVYLAASVPPQARRAIRRRRVVFRREVPLTLTAWHRTLVALAGCTTVDEVSRACSACEPHLAASPGRAASYLSHSPVSEAHRLSLGRAEVQSADGLYRSCLSVARQPEPCCSRVHRVDSSSRSDAAPHCPDPNLPTDVQTADWLPVRPYACCCCKWRMHPS